jgi:hypothetical protein
VASHAARLSPGDLDAIGDRLRDIGLEGRRLRAKLTDQVQRYGPLAAPHYQISLGETGLRLERIKAPVVETVSPIQSSLQQWDRLAE